MCAALFACFLLQGYTYMFYMCYYYFRVRTFAPDFVQTSQERSTYVPEAL